MQTTPSEVGLAPTTMLVTATFSEAVDASTLTTSSFTLTGPLDTTVAGAVSYEASARMAVFAPDAPLEGTTAYTATLSSAVTDLAGNAFEEPYSWPFTWRRPTRPPLAEPCPTQPSWAPAASAG